MGCSVSRVGVDDHSYTPAFVVAARTRGTSNFDRFGFRRVASGLGDEDAIAPPVRRNHHTKATLTIDSYVDAYHDDGEEGGQGGGEASNNATFEPPRQLARYCRGLNARGSLPASRRAQLWPILTGAERALRTWGPGLYRRLLESHQSVVAEATVHAIRKDLARTLSSNILFSEATWEPTKDSDWRKHWRDGLEPLAPAEPAATETKAATRSAGDAPAAAEAAEAAAGAGLASLGRLLVAVAVLDPGGVGYCQGMSNIAALLLLAEVPEEAAFFTLIIVLGTAQLFPPPPRPLPSACMSFGLRELYLPGIPLCLDLCECLRVCLQKRLPKLARHLEAIGFIDVSTLVGPPWFMTLFTNGIGSKQDKHQQDQQQQQQPDGTPGLGIGPSPSPSPSPESSPKSSKKNSSSGGGGGGGSGSPKSILKWSPRSKKRRRRRSSGDSRERVRLAGLPMETAFLIADIIIAGPDKKKKIKKMKKKTEEKKEEKEEKAEEEAEKKEKEEEEVHACQTLLCAALVILEGSKKALMRTSFEDFPSTVAAFSQHPHAQPAPFAREHCRWRKRIDRKRMRRLLEAAEATRTALG